MTVLRHSAVEGVFGPVTIFLDPVCGLAAVDGPAIPTALVRRVGGGEPDGFTPIGSRASGDLDMTVGGVEASLSPAKGRLSRRSYRVDATVNGVRYRLIPSTLDESVLLKDGTRAAEFRADGDAVVVAVWDEEEARQPVDVCVGYALAAAFGTGAQHFLATVLHAGAEALPW